MNTNEQLPYQNPNLSDNERVADLLGRMTLEEKVGQMLQLDARGGDLEHLVVERHVGSILHTRPEDLPKAVEMVRTQTRLGIPLVIGDDCIHGYSFWPGATIYPEELGMASSWDPAKVEKAARATAEEVSTTGVHWTFSPVLCIARDTRWGRVGETFGEDPTLIGEFGSAMVRGYQGGAKAGEPLAKDAILACAKHFAGYSETQGGRDASEADLSHRKLTSWFLPPFERVAREGVGSFMLGYESIEGVPVTYNHWLLNQKLRGDWGYKGMLVTDWDNVGRSVWEQKIKPDFVHASADAVKAGNDLVMTTEQFYDGALEAVKSGLLEESEIDEAVSRILAVKFRLGLFEDPRLPDQKRIDAVIGSEAHRQTNLELTRESIVLLRNGSRSWGCVDMRKNADGSCDDADSDASEASSQKTVGVNDANGGNAGTEDIVSTEQVNDGGNDLSKADKAVLPLDGKAIHRIAVVGPLADDAQTQLGDWAGNSGQVSWMPEGQPRDMITTVVDGLRAIGKDDGFEVTYAKGAEVVELVDDPAGPVFPDNQPRPKVAQSAPFNQGQLDEAVAVAKTADAVVAVVGDVIPLIGEGRSTATLKLQGGQVALLDALADVAKEQSKPFVVVLMSSKPQVLPDSALNADALLWAPSPGMEGGRAIAEIIMGITAPSGRLPITFPRDAGQLPVYYNQIRGQHGWRYADLTQDPAFAFGEGLSYTTFAYGDPQIEGGDTTFAVDDTLHVSIDVTNTGKRVGTEVVQAYVGDLVTSVSWTDRELKTFRRVDLKPGETKSVTFDIPVSVCSIVDADANRIVEPGEFELLVGHSSRRRDLKRTTFMVE
ncbi:glycoside hydrolase family 3 C-terminal domain-containing protein [Bifidobacterium sp. ESL0769]|uniref:glycoside hydrolase family 3 N-terminal domain-containing protein n=1 Tax=Bifidobacterium sp. ESL0769 TaxID=2983229 RepID=UPI0023FA0F78|nr:glycoside hydrolase family 3 N-terminal domain-containing protein [Bifidobacterium sp. ESL0769]WEV67015.1 glycoside hydrolase family 3 C-terminal domain-containing protein [Bifidobacterium sp. ESL0769]